MLEISYSFWSMLKISQTHVMRATMRVQLLPNHVLSPIHWLVSGFIDDISTEISAPHWRSTCSNLVNAQEDALKKKSGICTFGQKIYKDNISQNRKKLLLMLQQQGMTGDQIDREGWGEREAIIYMV